MSKPLSTARQLSVAFGLVLLLMAILAGMAGWSLADSNRRIKTIYEDRTVPLQQLGDVLRLGLRDRILLQDMLQRPDPANLKQRSEEILANRQTSQKDWRDYRATYLTPEEKQLADRLETATREYVDQGILAPMKNLQSGNTEAARDVLLTKTGPLSRNFTELTQQLINLQVRVAAEEFTESQTAFQRTTWTLAAGVAAAFACAIAAAVVITRRITRTLGAEPHQLARIAETIAAGDLQVLEHEPAGREGSVLLSMQKMRISLTEVVSTVRSGVDGVASASAQIAHGNSDLSSRTEEQASSLQQTAASVDQLNGTVTHSAESARKASTLAVDARDAASRGGQVVAEVVQTMQAISASSSKIADIISVIDSIAFQTNILALNAAVEAARAGEQGRGFAVVAGEVRSLASRSSQAAKEIKSLIDSSVEQVDAGAALVESAGGAMKDIVGRVHQVADLIQEVTEAAREQCAGIGQINTAVSLIDQTTQSNAALVEESAAAAESLRVQAERLARSVSVFKLPAG